ncbi:MAG: VWA domain-containing protein [Aestuariivirga sp.]
MNSVTPRPTDPGGKLAANIMHFGRVLREAGLPVGPSTVLDALDAAMAGPLRKREDFYWTLHSVFVKRRDQRELFDQAFHVFWKKPKMLEQLMQLMYVQIARKADDKKKQAGFRRLAEAMFEPQDAPHVEQGKQDLVEVDATYTASLDEVFRHKDFEQMTVAEQTDAKAAIARLRLVQHEQRTRRFAPNARGRRIDMRRTLRASLRTGGSLMVLSHVAPITRVPPLVVLCDISGSCAQYSRIFLHFLHALAGERPRVHIFLFGTQLTNITRDLQRRDVDDAVERVSAHVKDWSGGTRIGASLKDFNYHWGRRVLGQGAQVLLMTDGLERDDIGQLSEEMVRLRRTAKRITWLNPLLRYDKFEAAAAGIRAMMPYVDEFRPVHSLDSLADLAESLAKAVNFEHNPEKWMEAS